MWNNVTRTTQKLEPGYVMKRCISLTLVHYCYKLYKFLFVRIHVRDPGWTKKFYLFLWVGLHGFYRGTKHVNDFVPFELVLPTHKSKVFIVVIVCCNDITFLMVFRLLFSVIDQLRCIERSTYRNPFYCSMRLCKHRKMWNVLIGWFYITNIRTIDGLGCF